MIKKKTRIVCTLGPSTDTDEMVGKLMDAGMNVCRLNMSHGSYEEQAVRINRIKYRSLLGSGTVSGFKTVFMKPQTYMNLSGEAVGEAARFYKIPPEKVAVGRPSALAETTVSPSAIAALPRSAR